MTATLPDSSGHVRAEVARLLARGSQSRRLLRHRIELFVGIGVALGLLHLLAGRHGGGGSLAISATLGALVPVYAPLCFVPVAMADRQRGGAGRAVAIARIGVVTVLGWLVASVHLAVWALLGAGGSISGPSPYDVPFMVITVAVTAAIAGSAFQLPRKDAMAVPATILAAVGLYVATFVVHATLLTPTLSALRRHAGTLPRGIEAGGVVVGMAIIVLLLRREVRSS